MKLRKQDTPPEYVIMSCAFFAAGQEPVWQHELVAVAHGPRREVRHELLCSVLIEPRCSVWPES